MPKRTSLKRICRLESDLISPVTKYLRQVGCSQVASELPFFGRGIDVYGVRYSGRRVVTYAVELKLTKWARALQQAALYQLCCDFSYVAMPLRSAVNLDISHFRNAGIGILCVRPDGKIGTMLEAKRSPEKRRDYVNAMSRAILEVSSNVICRSSD